VQRQGVDVGPERDRPDGLSTVSVRKGEVLVTGTAPLPADSLRGLLSRIR